ncbi:thioesterase II family protein [Streptomyces sp. A012304]|uniref:thioesterase II family protein n=1 Tax=Streptomyces sp. A012304 TaxID=375446 RepID=UPI0022316EB9|nr:alpha/beta fold hydrolase [Streptomyces sp. A012304]GKQ41829.1 oleoyl-ACP hydrolase [Streptomyces sp. A012304]
MPPPHTRPDQWIRAFGPAPDPPAAIRLLCFPHAGGSASFYHPLRLAVGDAAEVLGVQYPGRQERRAEPAPTAIDALVDGVRTELKEWTDRPLVFFGHSMGAIVAYEVARRLEQESDTAPLGLIASGRRAPGVLVEENVHRRDDAGLLAEVSALSGTASSLLGDAEIRDMILPALRADYTAIETYRHRPGAELACPVTVIVGDADPRVDLDQARAWARHTTAAFDLKVFPGGHFYLGDQWRAVGEAVRACLTAFGRAAGR